MFEKFRSSKTYKIVNGIATSAILALLLSLVFFAYDVYKDDKQDRQDNEHFEQSMLQLEGIMQSLSTRYLGAFPSYLSETLNVFDHLQPQDTVIVFEDVLYYGIKSKPDEFRRFNKILINHARQGGKVIVAYYDNHATSLVINVFRSMVKEGRIAQQYHSQMQLEKEQSIDELKEKNKRVINSLDSVITDKYYIQSRMQNSEAAEKERQAYLDKTLVANLGHAGESGYDIVISRLCVNLDSIKQHHLGNGRTLEDIHYADYERMYSDMTDCIAECYRYHGVELIPLNEYLTMSCWMIKPANRSRRTEAVLAFPSKYASDEIGFYSQDASFEKYITMMLNGIRGNMVANQRHKEKIKNLKAIPAKP